MAEATTMVDLSSYPAGARLILRKERPHLGAQMTFTDVDRMRVTPRPGVANSGAGQPAGLGGSAES